MLAAKHAHISRQSSHAGALPSRSDRRSTRTVVMAASEASTARAAASRSGKAIDAPKLCTDCALSGGRDGIGAADVGGLDGTGDGEGARETDAPDAGGRDDIEATGVGARLRRCRS